MPRKKNNKDTIQHRLYRYAHLYNRDSIIYTHIRFETKKYRQTTGLVWHPDNFEYAMNLLEERLQEIQNPHPNGQSLNELFESYVSFKSKSVSYSAIKKYRQAWGHWVVKDYTTNEISQLRADIVSLIGKSILHTNTINKSLQMLSAFFRHLVELKLITDNPITTSILPKSKSDEPEQFTHKEIHTLINNFKIDSDMNLLLRLIANSGMRISEAVLLKKENFSPDWITFFGKGNIKRTIPIIPNSELSIISSILSKREKAFIWVGPTIPHRRLRKACENLKIDNKGFHGIRRYFENSLIDSGANIKATADILGHSLQIQSKHYKTKSKPERLLEAMKKLDN